MLEHFLLPDVSRVGRRTALGALAVAVVALGVASLLDFAWVGIGACIGLGLGLLNFRMITASVVRVGKQHSPNKRRPLAMNTLSRLGVISVITLGLLFLNFGLGFGVLGGLAVFQMLLLGNVTRAMWVAGHQSGEPGEGPQHPGGPAVIDTTAQPRGES